MEIYKKLLVPLDGSKLGESSFLFAKELAAKLNLSITFLHVSIPEEREFGPMHKAYVEWAADTIRRRSKEDGRPIATSGEVVVSQSAAEGIMAYARENDINLILMVTRARWDLGSVADRVLRTSRVPVCLVRMDSAAKISHDQWSNLTIIVPLDGSKLAEGILPHVEAMAKNCGPGAADVILIKVCEPPAVSSDYPEGMSVNWEDHVKQEIVKCQINGKQYLSGIEKQLDQAGIRVKQHMLVGMVADEIVDFAARIPSSLIAMSTHGRSGVGRWVFGSIAEKVLVGASGPILLVRPAG